jgi:hypothetical protein
VDERTLFAELVAAGMTRRQAVKEVARRSGRPAREVYARLLVTDRDDEPALE